MSASPSNFIADLNDVIDRCVSLMFHPGRPRGFTDPNEIHTEHSTVSLGNKLATVDRRIAPLIGELWRMGCRTVASCEEYTDHRAYVTFIGNRDALQLAIAIQNSGGSCAIQENSLSDGISFKTPDYSVGQHMQVTEVFGGISFRCVTVRFDPGLIEPVVERLRSTNDSQNRSAATVTEI